MSNNNAEEMWTKFVSLHENIVMVLSGHMEGNLLLMNQAKGIHGNTVSQFLIDQQAVDKAFMSAGKDPLGLVAMLYIDESTNTASFEWYSTIYNKYFQTVSQVTFDLDAECDPIELKWDGIARAPVGHGTKQSPYLVESAGNLLWMALQVNEGGDIILDEADAVFEGQYFKQVCDIDLAGLPIKSIGSYHTSQGAINKARAFGGNYDGGGYSIKNGYIAPMVTAHGRNFNWCDGLFGCVYGDSKVGNDAIKVINITVENTTIKGVASDVLYPEE
jgi:hypothetical protein